MLVAWQLLEMARCSSTRDLAAISWLDACSLGRRRRRWIGDAQAAFDLSYDALQRIIGEIKSRLGIPDPPPPPPPEAAGVQPRYGRKIPRAGAPGHFQKLPSDEH